MTLEPTEAQLQTIGACRASAEIMFALIRDMVLTGAIAAIYREPFGKALTLRRVEARIREMMGKP